MGMNKAEWTRRREAVFERLPTDSCAIVWASPLQHRNHDVEYPYRQNANFWYLIGLTEPNAVAVFEKQGAQQTLTLYCDDPTPEHTRWNGPRMGIKAAKKALGIEQVLPIAEFDAVLSQLLSRVKTVWHEAKGEALVSLEAANTEQVAYCPLNDLVAPLRMIKSADEIACCREAAQLSAMAHLAAIERAKTATHEYELMASLLSVMYDAGADWSYPPIVGAGKNACILHYTENKAPIPKDSLILIDAGAEIQGYGGDITRTFPASGQFTKPQRQLYEAVLAAQEAGIAAVRPGNPFSGVQDAILASLVPALVELKILSGDPEQLIHEKAYRSVYMHGAGHWLGLDVHDAGTYQTENGASIPLQPGMLLTVEPGVYIDPDNDEVPERFRGMGIRIEDDVLVTTDGCDVLSKDCPKAVEAIEALF